MEGLTAKSETMEATYLERKGQNFWVRWLYELWRLVWREKRDKKCMKYVQWSTWLNNQLYLIAAVLLTRITLMRIRIGLITLMRMRIRIQILALKKGSNPWKSAKIGSYIFHAFWLDISKFMRIRIQLINFDADPNADPDPEFYLMRMRIRMRIKVTTMMRILADPDPVGSTTLHCSKRVLSYCLMPTNVLRWCSIVCKSTTDLWESCCSLSSSVWFLFLGRE